MRTNSTILARGLGRIATYLAELTPADSVAEAEVLIACGLYRARMTNSVEWEALCAESPHTADLASLVCQLRRARTIVRLQLRALIRNSNSHFPSAAERPANQVSAQEHFALLKHSDTDSEAHSRRLEAFHTAVEEERLLKALNDSASYRLVFAVLAQFVAVTKHNEYQSPLKRECNESAPSMSAWRRASPRKRPRFKHLSPKSSSIDPFAGQLLLRVDEQWL